MIGLPTVRHNLVEKPRRQAPPASRVEFYEGSSTNG